MFLKKKKNNKKKQSKNYRRIQKENAYFNIPVVINVTYENSLNEISSSCLLLFKTGFPKITPPVIYKHFFYLPGQNYHDHATIRRF